MEQDFAVKRGSKLKQVQNTGIKADDKLLED